jgi:hypothetical protein
MALKPTRVVPHGQPDVQHYMNEVAAAGIVVIYNTPGGDSYDNVDSTVSVPTGTAGVPAGVLMAPVVDHDWTRTRQIWVKDEVPVGGKVPLLKRGVVHTNMLNTGDTPQAGSPAYFKAGGLFTTAAGSLQVGEFKGPADSDGYVLVEINLPAQQ